MILEQPFLKFDIYYDLQKYELSHAPDGWQDAQFTRELDTFFGTPMKKFETKLNFVYEGAHLLRQILWKNGANVKATLKISKLDLYTWKYNERVFADFDFYDVTDNGYGFSVGLLESGVMANIRSQLDTEFTIPVNSTTGAIPVNIGGIGVAQFAQWVGGPQAGSLTDGNYNSMSPSMTLVDDNITGDFMELQSDYPAGFFYLGDGIGDSSFGTVTAVTGFTSRIQGTVKANGAGWRINQKFLFYIYDDIGNKYFVTQKIYTGPTFGHSPIEFDFDLNVPFSYDRAYTLIIHSPSPNEGDHKYSLAFDSIELRIDYRTYTIDYHALGLRAFDLFKALMVKINPDADLNIVSHLLGEGEWHRLVILSGDCIRGIGGATINTSFRDFFQSIKVELFAGFKVYDDDTISLENLSYYFNPFAEAGDLGELSSAKFSIIQNKYFASISAGYTDQEYKTVDGKDEFNTEITFMDPASKATNTIDLKSTYRADPRGIDQLLIDFRADPTTDTKSDKEIFMVQVNELISDDGYYHLTGVEEYANVEGVSALGRIYNLNFSPGHMMYRNSPMLSVPFALSQSGDINFQTSKKNSALKITNFNGTVFVEKANFTYATMMKPIFLPIQMKATTHITDTLYDTIIASSILSNGFVKCSFQGVKYKVFIVGDSFNLTKDNKKEFTFYLTPDSAIPV